MSIARYSSRSTTPQRYRSQRPFHTTKIAAVEAAHTEMPLVNTLNTVPVIAPTSKTMRIMDFVYYKKLE
jgi:hypothetical protein